MSGSDEALAVYDRLWAAARETFAAGRVKTDPYLLDRAADRRRGISLVIRPSPPVIARLGLLIDELSAIVPRQHVYRPGELHLTLLALVNVSAVFDRSRVPLDRYRAVLGALFPQVQPFDIHFTGVTASPDTVFVFGYSEDDALNTLRDRLREELTRAGLGETLDRRYRIVTTHSTVLRFRSQPENLPDLVRFVESTRARDLGVFTVDGVEFTFNDWYMSHDVAQSLAFYPLRRV